MKELVFTKKQLERIDEIENACYAFLKVLTERDDLPWDMSIIGELSDIASDMLVNHGWLVRYPAIVLTPKGRPLSIVNYHTGALRKRKNIVSNNTPKEVDLDGEVTPSD